MQAEEENGTDAERNGSLRFFKSPGEDLSHININVERLLIYKHASGRSLNIFLNSVVSLKADSEC